MTVAAGGRSAVRAPRQSQILRGDKIEQNNEDIRLGEDANGATARYPDASARGVEGCGGWGPGARLLFQLLFSPQTHIRSVKHRPNTGLPPLHALHLTRVPEVGVLSPWHANAYLAADWQACCPFAALWMFMGTKEMQDKGPSTAACVHWLPDELAPLEQWEKENYADTRPGQESLTCERNSIGNW